MADVLPDLTKMGQQALELPTNVLNTEMRQMNEKVGVLNAEIQKLTANIPILGQGLPNLPLPGMPQPSGTPPQETPATRSAAIQGTRSTKSKSYMAGVK